MKTNEAEPDLFMSAPIDHLNEAARWLAEHRDDTLKVRGQQRLILPPTIVVRSRRNYALKRGFDVVLGLLAVLLLWPIMAIIAVLIRLNSVGPSLFKQQRVGEGGKLFTCYKFRSMRMDADERLHREDAAKFLRGEAIAIEHGQPVYKPANDPRVTRVGRLLRATSLDELPQFFNVVRGDMSLVGPRPPIPYEVDQYRYRHRYRLLVKPGITGIWQVYGRSRVDFETLVSMDLNYITDSTLLLDLKLIIMTFLVIFKRSGR